MHINAEAKVGKRIPTHPRGDFLYVDVAAIDEGKCSFTKGGLCSYEVSIAKKSAEVMYNVATSQLKSEEKVGGLTNKGRTEHSKVFNLEWNQR